MAVTHQNSDFLTLVKIRYYPSERLPNNIGYLIIGIDIVNIA
jgi:hypothetical protein